MADRDLPLLHHLEQRRLHLRGRAVDLVGEQEVAEDRAELRVEVGLVGPEDPRADQVARHEVGRELHALERPAEHGGGGLDRERLREAGHALDQEVPAGEQAHEHPLEHLLLTCDHPADLEQRLLEPAQKIRVGRDGVLICHEGLLRSFAPADRTGFSRRMRTVVRRALLAKR